MIVAGVMSGTSADGINVALVKCGCGHLAARRQLLAHAEYRVPGSCSASDSENDECENGERSRPGAPQLSFRRTLRRGSSKNREQASCKAGSGRLPRANHLSPGNPRPVSRPANSSYLANRRRRCHRRTAWRAGGLRFSSRRHGRRRQGRAAGPVSRLRPVSRPTHRSHRTKHRRDRESHRDSRSRIAAAGDRL